MAALTNPTRPTATSHNQCVSERCRRRLRPPDRFPPTTAARTYPLLGDPQRVAVSFHATDGFTLARYSYKFDAREMARGALKPN